MGRSGYTKGRIGEFFVLCGLCAGGYIAIQCLYPITSIVSMIKRHPFFIITSTNQQSSEVGGREGISSVEVSKASNVSEIVV